MKLPRDAPVTIGRRFIHLQHKIVTAILRTVEAGWALASQWPDVNADADEVVITEQLREGMRDALRGTPWSKNMIVLPGTESRSRQEVPLPDGRTDIPILLIQIFLRSGEHDPHAIIECKRIAGGNSRLCRKYVGLRRKYVVEGIDRFQTGKYAGNHSTGFMVGYLVAGSAAAAVAGINYYLNGKKRHDENLKRSNLVSESWVWGSRHPRSNPPPIEIHHAFLKIGSAHC